MRVLTWNCRRLGGPFTISQLKESTRLHLLYLIFIYETKQAKGFLGIVCKKLKLGDMDSERSSGKKRRNVGALE